MRIRIVIAAMVAGLLAGAAPESRAEALVVKSALVRLVERVELSSRVDGVLQAVNVSEGDRVEAGDLLAQIDDAEARAIHDRALLEAKIAKMEAENDVALRDAERVLEVALRELSRARQTVQRVPGSLSESKLDMLQLAADQAELAVERARRELEVKQVTLGVREKLAAEALVVLERHKIVSPLPGVVAAVEKRAGETVTVAEKTFRVVNDQRLRVEGFLATRDYRPGLTGAQAGLEFTLPDGSRHPVSGRVVFVSPENDPHNGEIRVWIEFENPQGRWRPGMRPRVTIDAPPPALSRSKVDR